jgi:hypothetical protein
MIQGKALAIAAAPTPWLMNSDGSPNALGQL